MINGALTSMLSIILVTFALVHTDAANVPSARRGRRHLASAKHSGASKRTTACWNTKKHVCTSDKHERSRNPHPSMFSPGPVGVCAGETFRLVQASCRLPDRPRTPAPCSSMAKNTSTSCGRGCSPAWHECRRGRGYGCSTHTVPSMIVGTSTLKYQWAMTLKEMCPSSAA